MVTLLQRTAPNTLAETKDRAKAIYFQIDAGSLHPIDELEDEMVDNNNQIVVQNIPLTSNKVVEPLGLPVMNFEDEDGVSILFPDTKPEEDEESVQNANSITPLGLPTMNFNAKKKDKKREKKQTANQHGIEPLGLPVWSF